MTGAIECRYSGRDFTVAEITLLRALITGPPALTRWALSSAFCRRINWRKPDGGLKELMAHGVMFAMHRDDVIPLPPTTQAYRQPKPALTFGPDTEPPRFPPPTDLDAVCPLALCIVVGTPESCLWNEFIAHYHTLGHKTLVDNQMCTFVTDRNREPLALLDCSTTD